MMQLPVFCSPEVWSFVPNCIMELAVNLLLVLFLHCLSFQCILVIHSSMNIKEHSITLILLCTSCTFFKIGNQISFYVLGVTDVGNQDPTFYTWNETEGSSGVNEVASGVTCYEDEVCFDNSVTTIRFFADGCKGQNKNMHMVHVLIGCKRKHPLTLKILLYSFQ